jgi:hypothetical protein
MSQSFNQSAEMNELFKKILDTLDDTIKNIEPSTINRLDFFEKGGKYFVGETELNPSKLEEWGSIMIAEMAKRLLK